MARLTRLSTTGTVSTSHTIGQEIDPLHILEVSFNDLSSTALLYTDLSSRLLSWGTSGGRGSELDELDARTWSGVLDNRDRALDPTNAASAFAPNVVPNRRLRHRLQTNSSSKTYDIFFGYVDGWGPTWPQGQEWANAEAHVTATDGRKILANHYLTAANPDVLECEEVIDYDDPTLSYRMGEPRGTKLVARTRRIRHRHKGKKKPHVHKERYRARVTAAPLEGVSGPSGSYVNAPLLGQPGIIAGDLDTCVHFTHVNSQYARVALSADDLIRTNRLTVEAWVNLSEPTGLRHIVAGPYHTTLGLPVFSLDVAAFNPGFPTYQLTLQFTDGTQAQPGGSSTSVKYNTWTHLVGTWDGTTARFYVNGTQSGVVTPAAGKVLRVGNEANPSLKIGSDPTDTVNNRTVQGYVDEVAIYETALSQPRIQAHFDAASLGVAAASTSERIVQVMNLTGQYDFTSRPRNIRGGARTLLPTRYAGLAPTDLIDEAVEGEAAPAVFFFSKTGVPTFLDANHRSVAPWSAPLYTFGLGAGEIPYAGRLTMSDEDAFLYNDVRVTKEDGETAIATDATSIGRFGRRTLTISLPSGSSADATAIAAAYLARFKDPMIRITAFELDGTDPAAKDALLSLELGDPVTVRFQPPGGGAIISQTSYVERISLATGTAGEPIYGTFGISPR